MEVTELQSEFAEVLNSFNDLVKPLRNIQSFRGCEFFVNDLIKKIQSFLVTKGVFNNEFVPCPEKQESLREIILLLVANIDATYFSSVSDDAYIFVLVGILPLISMNLFYMLIWKLNIQQTFLELITYSPIPLVANLMIILPDALTHLDEDRNLDFAEKFIVAFYKSIFYLPEEDYETDSEAALGSWQIFLNDYFKNDPEAFPGMRKSQFNIHLGQMIRHLLHAVIKCLGFWNDQKTDEGFFKELPEIYGKAFLGEEFLIDEDNPILSQFHEKLFGKLQNLIDGVTVLTFCDWMDVETQPGVTLQQAIGDLTRDLNEIPKDDDKLKHEVFEQIKCLMRESKNDQATSEFTIGELLNQLETLEMPGEKSIVVKELISRGEIVLGNEECLEEIEKNFEALKLPDFIELAKFLQNSNSETEETIRNLLLRGIRCLSVEEAVQLVTTELIYLPSTTMQTDSLEVDVEAFLAAKRWPESEYLRLLAQNPRRVIEKMSLWVIDHERDMKIALKLLQMTQKITGMFLEENIRHLIGFPTPTSSRLLANWICRLFNCGLLKKSKIVKSLSKNLVEFVTKRDEKRILGIITVFSVLAQKSTYGEESAKVLAIAGRVLDNSRWTLETYTEELKEIVRLSIVTIVETMKDFLKYASQAEKDILKEKTSTFSPPAAFFFQKLSLNRSTAQQNYAEFLFKRESLKDVSQEDLQEFLSKIIIQSTAKETAWLASNEFLRPLFEGVLQRLGAKVSGLPSAVRVAPTKCFRNCMANYHQALEKIIIPELTEEREKVIFLHRLLEMINTIPQEIYDEILLNLLPLISTMFDGILEGEESIPDCNAVLRDQINGLRDCKLKRSLLIKFRN